MCVRRGTVTAGRTGVVTTAPENDSGHEYGWTCQRLCEGLPESAVAAAIFRGFALGNRVRRRQREIEAARGAGRGRVPNEPGRDLSSPRWRRVQVL